MMDCLHYLQLRRTRRDSYELQKRKASGEDGGRRPTQCG